MSTVTETVRHVTNQKDILAVNQENDDNNNNIDNDKSMINDAQDDHNQWRIALYYHYINIENVPEHVAFHHELCQELNLKGRIRISSEGINGVLSGLWTSLQQYETKLTQQIQQLLKSKQQQDDNDDAETMNTGTNTTTTTPIVDLDIKYCHLRQDLAIPAQLFDSLIVKETKTVISLCDQAETAIADAIQRQRGNTNRGRGRRRRRRKQQQQEQATTITVTEPETKETTITTTNTTTGTENNAQASSSTPVSSFQWEEVLQKEPSPHLNAKEWNEQLEKAAAAAASTEHDDSSSTNINTALLLDVRNVYESRIGHFRSPNVPTLLTNTRKYSDLPQLLATNPHVQSSNQIFMYCTGGVRCERVSQLVQTLYPSKQVYQLQGGIQTYLREVVEEQGQLEKQNDNSNVQDDTQQTNTTLTSKFHGKNFVFDPRRTDPIYATNTFISSHDDTAAADGIIGKCLICNVPHDDYDNGHAPNENKEARCNHCRMLILICNECRPNYKCWGEEDNDGKNKPLLYCGGIEKCVHEGSAPEPELIQEML